MCDSDDELRFLLDLEDTPAKSSCPTAAVESAYNAIVSKTPTRSEKIPGAVGKAETGAEVAVMAPTDKGEVEKRKEKKKKKKKKEKKKRQDAQKDM